jgi:hypothetical protein
MISHELHVHEQRLVEPAEVHEVDDVGLRHRPPQRAIDGADGVGLEVQSLSDHVLPHSPR